MRADLTRRSIGLSEAHKELIRLLAELAVENFLRESEAQAPGTPIGESSTQGKAQSSEGTQ